MSGEDETVRAPDVAFISQKRLDEVGPVQGYWPGAPDLAAEVVSPNDLYTEVNGIGLRRDADVGWVVKVNLAGEDAGLRSSLPPRVDGVRVDIAVVGPVRASTD